MSLVNLSAWRDIVGISQCVIEFYIVRSIFLSARNQAIDIIEILHMYVFANYVVTICKTKNSIFIHIN